MKKKLSKKLRIRRETLQALQNGDLKKLAAAGGQTYGLQTTCIPCPWNPRP